MWLDTFVRNFFFFCVVNLSRKKKKNMSEAKEEITAEEKVESGEEITCGICLLNIEELTLDYKYGVLPKCKHQFCLPCLERWRGSVDYATSVSMGCPVCRVVSKYMYPSTKWPESDEDRKTMKLDYCSILNLYGCPCKRKYSRCPYGNNDARVYHKHMCYDNQIFLNHTGSRPDSPRSTSDEPSTDI